MKHAIQRIHFVGIGGSGMSGIAEVLHNLGYEVTGSDAQDGSTLHRLRRIGILTRVGHDKDHLGSAQVLVVSSAISSSNPEYVEARATNIPIVPRAAMLAELMRFKHGIAVAGTHGKTTTTSLVASILAQAGLDPTFVIGGKLNSAGVNARLGGGEYIVVEADESDGSFLNLTPLQAIVTNIDEDHMATYGHDRARLDQAFLDFIHRMPFYGEAVVCTDDPGVKAILPRIQRPVLTYGLSSQAMLQGLEVRTLGEGMAFTVREPGGETWAASLQLAGAHNVRNALAAIGVTRRLGVERQHIQAALAGFKGVGRRFQQVGTLKLRDGGTARVIDDYGHHPVELAAVIDAARGAYPGHRIVLAFQPHRYTRTRDCFEDFVEVLNRADVVLLTEVYAAGELPIVAADGRSLVRALRVSKSAQPIFVPHVEDLPSAIAQTAEDGDVILCMGAGSIGSVASAVVGLSSFAEISPSSDATLNVATTAEDESMRIEKGMK